MKIAIHAFCPGLQDLHGGQFFVGPEGSGAPVHFHSSAVNALYYGRKRWILIPPMQVGNQWLVGPCLRAIFPLTSSLKCIGFLLREAGRCFLQG